MLVIFFTKNPNLKKEKKNIFFWGGGEGGRWGDGGDGARVSNKVIFFFT